MSMIRIRQELESLFVGISLTNPAERTISLLWDCPREERGVILKDGTFWLGLLCSATSLKFEHQNMREMSLDEIGQLYLLFGVKGNPLETVLYRVRSTYLGLPDWIEPETCDCFFILMSLYQIRKCQGFCCEVYSGGFCSDECREIYKDIGKHYGVSFFL